MRDYELIFIIQPDLDDETLESTVARVVEIITSKGGEVTKTDTWGKRRLSYPIRRYREGHYTRLELKLKPDTIRDIEHDFKLTEPLMRHLIVRMDEISS